MSFNLQSAICSLQSAVCGLRSAVCSLQSAVCGLQSAVCGLQMSYTETKTLKALAQPYLELKRIYTVSNSQSNELLLLDAFRRVLA